MEKKEFRKEMLTKRRSLSHHRVEHESQKICRKVMDSSSFETATTVLAYMPTQNEVDVIDIIVQSLLQGKTVGIPRCLDKAGHMEFRQITSFQEVAPGAYGILEPTTDCPLLEPAEALLLVPGVAFDADGFRLGYGGGYYDRYLAEHPELHTMGMAYDEQIVEKLPVGLYDQKLQDIVTPTRWFMTERKEHD